MRQPAVAIHRESNLCSRGIIVCGAKEGPGIEIRLSEKQEIAGLQISGQRHACEPGSMTGLSMERGSRSNGSVVTGMNGIAAQAGASTTDRPFPSSTSLHGGEPLLLLMQRQNLSQMIGSAVIAHASNGRQWAPSTVNAIECRFIV